MKGGVMRYLQIVGGKAYFRKRGCPSRPLRSPLPATGQEQGSAMEAEIRAVLAELEPTRPLPGTLKAALRVYELESADFAALAPSTRREYLYVMRELGEDFGSQAIATFSGPRLNQMRNTWAKRGYRAANMRLQILKNVLWPSVIAGAFGGADPFSLVGQVRRPHSMPEPHIIWPEAVVRIVVEAAIGESRFGIARGVALGRYQGPRLGDIVRMAQGNVVEDRIRWLSGKRKIRVDQPLDEALSAVLAQTPRARRGASLAIAYNMDGRHYTEDGFALELGKLIDRLHLAGRLDTDRYGVHGLRHTYGVEGALSGWTDAQGAAMMGHGSPHSFATYRRQADRIRMSDDAAEMIRALRERAQNAAVKTDVQTMCKTVPLSPSRRPLKS